MSTINFNLRNPKSDSKTAICLIYRWNDKKIKVSTRLSIRPKDWNFKMQRVKKGKAQGKSYNDLLDHYEISLTKLILKRDQCLDSITSDIIKSELFGIPIKDHPGSRFTDYMIDYIDRKQNIWSRSTYNSYCNTLRKVKSFLVEKRIQNDFESIDLVFYDHFVQFLFAPPYLFSINNVGKHIQNLKAVLNSAVSDGTCKNFKFKHKSFKKLKQKTSHIYLNLTELELIRTARLKSTRLAHARDLLLVLCFTGLRYSDLYKVNKKSLRRIDTHLGKVFILEILTNKTGQVVIIPCHRYVNEILHNHEFQLPKYSNQKLNVYIKEVAQLAGIDSIVSETSSIGGKPVVFNEPKYKFVCTHTGRRSLITNLYLSKIDNRSIQRLSGHLTETELSKYIGINDIDNTISLAGHAFFGSKA